VAHEGVDDFPYQAIVGLVAIADECWNEIDGACARTGVDPLRLPFDRFLRLVYAWVMERIQYDPNTRTDIDELLFGVESPLNRVTPDSVAPEVVDEEMALFRAASATLQSDVKRG
jgi:hypothetical protein